MEKKESVPEPAPIQPIQVVPATDTEVPNGTGSDSATGNSLPPESTGLPSKGSGTGASTRTGATTLTGAAEDAEVKAAVDEIDHLFDGIAGDSGSTKK